MPLPHHQQDKPTDFFSLAGIVIVAGAFSPHRIGFVATGGCAEMGAAVALTYHTQEQETQQNNTQPRAYHHDVTSDASVKSLIQRRGRRSFVLTVSMSGHIANSPQEQMSYNVANDRVIYFARSLANEWREFARDTRELWGSMVPAGREGISKELKRTYVYLVSGASSYTTGADVLVDGDTESPDIISREHTYQH
ncbi:hypothetical protein BDW62DRAFT_213420 [Aspergillus aurantiobrunneus]